MSLSTSSSEPAQQKVRYRLGSQTALALVLLLGLLEVASRTVLTRAAKDLRRFESYPERARVLMGRPGPHVVFVGSSTTDFGVDGDLFTAQVKARTGVAIAVEKFVADASRIDTWSLLIRHEIWDQGLRPETIIISFCDPDLRDGNPIEIGRLARHFTSLKDWPEVFSLNLTTTSDRIDFIISSGWATYAARSRVKDRALDLFVPHFKDYVSALNTANIEHIRQHAKASAPPAAITHRVLERFLALARDNGARLFFVAYPVRPIDGTPVLYPVAPETLAVLRAAGAAYLDLRAVPGLDATRYLDGLHLTPHGAQIYTTRLAQELSGFVTTATPAVSPSL